MATSKQRSDFDDHMVVTVTAEHTIGQINVSPDGTGPPVMVEGMRLISEYEYDHPEGGRYRVPLPNGTTQVVTVDYESQADVTEWLQQARPSVWTEWERVRKTEGLK